MRNNRVDRIRNMVCGAAVALGVMAAAVPALAAPVISNAEYEGRGRVEVDFLNDVSYNNVNVEVRDSAGTVYSAVINERDDDDLTFTIENFKSDSTYSYTISGIREYGENSFGQVSGEVVIPGAASIPDIKKADYDREDGEVEFELASPVEWSEDVLVTISDGSKDYPAVILEKEQDSIDLRVDNLEYGKEYTYKISGIRVEGGTEYRTISGTFLAEEKD